MRQLLPIVLAVVVTMSVANAGPRPQLDGVEARIKRVTPVAEGVRASVLQVEVRNDGRHAIEPLLFRVDPRSEGVDPVTVARAPLPPVARAGRAIAPRKRETYPLLVPLSADALANCAVEVHDACLWAPSSSSAELEVEARDLKLGRPAVHGEEGSAWTSATVQNGTEHHIDVVLEATFRNDGGGECLVGVTLEPGGERDLEIRALTTAPFAGERLLAQAAITRLELVDWTVRVDPGARVARNLLAGAWDSWTRIPSDLLPASASFTAKVDHKRLFGPGGTRYDLMADVTGRLWIDADRRVQIECEQGEGLPRGAAAIARLAVEDALGWISRAPYDEASRDWELRLVESGDPAVVRMSGAGDVFRRSVLDLRIVDGVITASAYPGGIGSAATEWRTETIGDAWGLLAMRRESESQGVTEQTATYASIEDVAVLETWTTWEEDTLTDAPRRTTVTFDGWEFRVEAPTPPAPPTGPLADELREAWDGFYRYPDPFVELTGTYEMTIKGGDGIWLGRREVEGAFSLRNFDNGYWRHRTVDCDDEKADADTLPILVNAVEDRIGMWSGRVPCWRASFDEEFAGVALAEGDGRGWIALEGHQRLGAVRVSGGKVDAIRFPSGAETSYRWRKKGDVLLPTRVERVGNGNVDLDWDEVAPGWWLPKRAHFTEIFGPSWGPETLEMDFDAVTPLRHWR